MSLTFTKLFSSITESTVWCEPASTRLVWITMLAMSDWNGRIWASIPGLANRARVPILDTEAALKTFTSPDPYSRTPDNEGRRVEAIDGGWRLLNHEKYRNIRDEETRREQNRNAQQKSRDKKKGVTEKVSDGQRASANVSVTPPKSAHTDTETDRTKIKDIVPLPVDAAVDKSSEEAKRRRVQAIGIIHHLNVKGGFKYQAAKPHIMLILARMNEGATVEQLQQVIESKVAEWQHDPEMRKHLSPDTLFNATKFAKYVGQIGTSANAPPKLEQVMVIIAGEKENGENRALHTYSHRGELKPEVIAREFYNAKSSELTSAGWRNLCIETPAGVLARFSVAELGQQR